MATLDLAAYLTARRAYDLDALTLQLRINQAVTGEEKTALAAQMESHLLSPPEPGEFMTGAE